MFLNLGKRAHLLSSATTKVCRKPRMQHQKNALLNSIRMASIYTKDTDLDRKRYVKENAEEELLLSYYQNHMESDKLSDEERATIQAKADTLIEKLKAKDKAPVKAEKSEKNESTGD